MSHLKCLILEDEPLAAELLTDYIAEVPYLKLAGSCDNAFKASEFLKKVEIDVIFLDLHLPKVKGFEFLQSISHPPQIIVTSAYHQYALEGYEHNIVDYLLKPIELPRFIQAVNKLELPQNQQSISNNTNGLVTAKKDHIFIQVNREKTRLNFSQIIYIESLRQYIKIITENRSLITKVSIGDFEKTLPYEFCRIHKSYIVSLEKILSFTHKHVTMITKQVLPVGDYYRDSFLMKIDH